MVSSRSNAGLISDYSFKFILETPVNSGPTIVIEFPPEFANGLGIASCVAYRRTEEIKTSIACSVTDRTVSFTFNQIPAGVMWLELHDVTNPTTSRGTGNFKVSTKSNGFVIDEDPFYPSIGITNAPADFATPTFTCDTTALSRHSPRYKFSAPAAVAIPTNSFMKVTLPA